MQISGDFAPSGLQRGVLVSSQHASGLIPETESHIIPWSLRIPYHPLQMLTRHANQT